MTEPIAPTERRCIACQSSLATGASVCPVCKSWQSRWRNALVFLGGSAGFLAILATAITYVTNTIYTAWSQREDAQVLQLQYPGYQIFDNAGTIPIMLSHFELYWRGQNTPVIIGVQLEPKQMYYHADALESLRKSFPSAAYVANASGDGTAFLSKSSPDTNTCYMLVFFSNNAPEIGQLNTFFAPGKVKLATVKLDAALYYYSTNDAALHSRPFQAVAAFYDLKKKNCSQPAAVERDRRQGQP
jgi:hypothetical protein